MGPTHVKASA